MVVPTYPTTMAPLVGYLTLNTKRYGDIDSSSSYTNPDHDVIITLSALRTKLPFRLASLHVRAHQDGHCESSRLPPPAQLNLLPFPKYSRTSGQWTNLPNSIHYPHAASTYVMAQGTSRAAKNARSRRFWTAHTPDSINWTAYRAALSTLTDQGRTFVIKLSHDWLPVGVREHIYGAPNATCPKCIQPETVSHLYLCHSRTNWHD
jgi:hypothetical protein